MPFHSGANTSVGSRSNKDWWPEQLNLNILHQNGTSPDPMGSDFSYAEAFKSLDLSAVKKDIEAVMTDSQEWWPADYGHYGPFFIRMAWHAAGTYRIGDGRGGAGAGQLRFAPLNSWPDNGNLDKARRLLWPVKKKYGSKISWADLMVLTGNVALESMGFETFGFGGGRERMGAGRRRRLGFGSRMAGRRALPRRPRARQSPRRGSDGPHLRQSRRAQRRSYALEVGARDIRQTFARMAMNDEETVALIAGGHTFGKAHEPGPADNVGVEPEGASLKQQGFGWKNSFGSGKGGDTITSGLEGAWTPNPIQWDNAYFELMFKYEWELTKSPAGAQQWVPTNCEEADMVPDAHDPSKKHAPIMLTTDLALRADPIYEEISRRFWKTKAPLPTPSPERGSS